MASCCSSLESISSFEKLTLLRNEPRGTHKIHYDGSGDWDFILETQEAIDMSLVIPHYRARHQPVDHRLNLFVGAEAAPVKLRICRPVPRCKFYLEVHAATSNVTVWLPSDFRGHIRHSGRASYSAGFVNRMMANIRLNENFPDESGGDEVIVHTQGTVTFRMWDVHTSAPENPHRETWRRMFGCLKKAPETSIDWDFLLDD
ncbi:hypothetical protein PAXRUDRAFT_826488 [Paxillus rubicundulus Ve08.2h10]|uniref:DUF7330 domain-containing protein n=1 Tax=Paxillus rubicundulus Ve08.2h10 TaxID=930991 RepID=A0A0D0DZJ3_9AGAM|nr:hypothetical protein PAXRUDRAFT_826488 [Paxillus rubicundulus Ve08.2h10]